VRDEVDCALLLSRELDGDKNTATSHRIELPAGPARRLLRPASTGERLAQITITVELRPSQKNNAMNTPKPEKFVA
jgi:hypothetical protein